MQSVPNMVETARRIATEAHRGQTDKGGNPYILHPESVSAMVEGELLKTIALLHDVVEDTKTTLDDLRAEGFPECVIEAVDCLTKRSGESRHDYLSRVIQNEPARMVKLADIRHNMDLSRIPNPTDADRERFDRYREDAQFLA